MQILLFKNKTIVHKKERVLGIINRQVFEKDVLFSYFKN